MSDSRSVEDSIEYFLQDMTYHGKSERTVAAYERVLRDFDRYLSETTPRGGDSVAPDAAGYRDCMAWIHEQRGELAESTIASYASYLHRFYAYMVQTGEFDTNPMTLVMEEMDETIETNPTRRDISLPRMREFVTSVRHPLHHAVLMTFLKTGMRAGELCNLDLRDVSLEAIEDVLNVTPRAQLDNRGEAIVVLPDRQIGDVTEGEERTASNKRRRATIVPVDDELAAALTRWLSVRPEARSDAEPLFVSTASAWGRRLTPDMVHHVVESYTAERGWHRSGAGAEENVTPHYFRHFFTTHLRDRTGDRGVVKYLRGDVADDVIDTYTHDWGDRVRETYLAEIYQLY
ncbi:tyrosine-type recombinase/integrase [Halobium palmae]|uniref:Tyrosine-type recombinase/integrase n=1 Tax=Halobium palmae TaxID=1776492 RepID=A0ABD5RXG8_9EURY